jgi:hypothetical protein
VRATTKASTRDPATDRRRDDEQIDACLRKALAHRVGDLEEEQVAEVARGDRKDDADRVDLARCERPRARVGAVLMTRSGGLYRGARGFGHLRIAVQRAADGGQREAQFFGDLLEGHGETERAGPMEACSTMPYRRRIAGTPRLIS